MTFWRSMWSRYLNLLSSAYEIIRMYSFQLLAEIKKKNRVIQHYLMSLEPGALISEESDIHKVGQPPFRSMSNYRRV